MATSDALSKTSCYWYDSNQLEHPEKGHDLYDPRSEEPPDETLMALIKEHGYIGAPMVVVREGKQLLIVEGRRRHRAIEALNKGRKGDNRIRCKVEFAKGEAFDSMLVGNLGRKEETTLQLAEKALRLEKNGYDRAHIARKFAVSGQTIDNWIKLATSPKDVRDAVQAGAVTPTLAKDLAKKPAEERKAILKDGPVKGASGKAKVRGPGTPGRKVATATLKALYKELPEGDKGFHGFARALVGYILGVDPNGETLAKFHIGAELIAKAQTIAAGGAK